MSLSEEKWCVLKYGAKINEKNMVIDNTKIKQLIICYQTQYYMVIWVENIMEAFIVI